ncbi:hypothetical protein K2173_005993 [Erythroxylum novogranatense]|uniref:Uncharacterized protein n=1 Tax=Erythroxylum novogranatense TaxID=1862640 RepID=A0AAV8TDP5_9ROSI|nr:hypothetical protein K2173_005993 [Erythroxylum novogranatense]
MTKAIKPCPRSQDLGATDLTGFDFESISQSGYPPSIPIEAPASATPQQLSKAGKVFRRCCHAVSLWLVEWRGKKREEEETVLEW